MEPCGIETSNQNPTKEVNGSLFGTKSYDLAKTGHDQLVLFL
jgi:hypothetical protein